MTHTPGPWTAHEKGAHSNPYVCGPTVELEHGKDQFVVAYIVGVDTGDNARLIAAAPELLSALANLLALIDANAGRITGGELEFGEARTAIAKAEGLDVGN